ncbi:DNA replication/repair protein RecF [Aerococcus viridans]|uniref:DNA replication/repair protein RecF n=1 Tax=Aerococcus TaxID=1375 RepID=UPI003B225F11
MQLNDIKLKDFRNYEDLTVTFSPGVNVFIGENAQGKTSLLEAIYMMSLARSHRTANEKDTIRWQQDFARIEGSISTRTNPDLPLALTITKSGKRAKVNHLNQNRMSDYIGKLNVVLFAPEDLELIKGAPQLRRKFIDMELGQMSPKYLYESVQYNRLLKQRNAYLKQLLYKETQDQIYLDILTEQLAASATHVIYQRIRFVDQLESWAKPIHSTISHALEELTLAYRGPIELTLDMTEDAIYQQLMMKFKEKKDHELARGVTLVGPHRDDLTFKVNGRDVQKFGSQGQQRTTVLSMKLAEIEYMHEVLGEYPILLLDDVLSELDNERQTHLLKSIQSKVQTFLTTTSLDGIQRELIEEPRVFNIDAGAIAE